MTMKKLLIAMGLDEFKEWSMLRRLLAELIGTFLLVTISLSGILENKSTVDFALANGLVLASIITFTGHVSGGHVNPAVTLGMVVCNYITSLPAICYILMQLLGAFCGQLVAKSISQKKHVDNFHKLDYTTELGLEILETLLLVLVALSVSDPSRNTRGVGSAGLAIGLSLVASSCAVVEYRASLNPAGYLATSMFKSEKHNWVYWVGPLIGGLLAGLVYRFILRYRPTRITFSYSHN